MEETKSNGKGYGVVSLVTGILSLITIQFIILSIIFAVIAIVFGIIGRKKGDNNLSKAGLSIGIVTVAITLALYIFLEVLDVSLFVVPSWYR